MIHRAVAWVHRGAAWVRRVAGWARFEAGGVASIGLSGGVRRGAAEAQLPLVRVVDLERSAVLEHHVVSLLVDGVASKGVWQVGVCGK